MPLAVQILVVFGLVVANGLLAMAEIAIVSSRKARLRHLADSGRRGARSALKLAENPKPFLSSVQIGITVVSIGLGAFGEGTLARRMETAVAEVPLFRPYAAALSIVVVVGVIGYLSLVIGELVPKQLALRNAEGVAIALARPMRLLAKLTYPLVRLLTVSAAAVVKLLRLPPAIRPTITEEEVKMIIVQAAEAGAVKEVEQDMMIGVLKLGDLMVRDLMTPRHEMVTLRETEVQLALWPKIIDSGHSYFPVLANRGDIIGVASIKTFIARQIAGQPLDPGASMTPPFYLPETLSALKALEKMKIGQSHIALVLNEHGSVEGLLTVNDLLEAVVGDMPDAAQADAEPDVTRREDGSYLVDGGVSTSAVKELLKLKKLPRDEGAYTTLGGMMMARLGRIPRTGDSFKWRNFRFEVVDMDRHRVDKVLIKKLPKAVAIIAKGGDKEAKHTDDGA